MKIALGTAQFGLDYGVANQSGRVPLKEVKKILQQAFAHGVDTIDTAIAYGDSESVLGEAGVSGWNIVTKLPAVPDNCSDLSAWVDSQIQQALVRLQVDHLYGVLLHRPDQLLCKTYGNSLFKALQRLKKNGVTSKIGVSIYEPSELEVLWPEFQIDLVQAPFNIIDRRLMSSGWLARMHAAGTEVHVRSVFLQGLLLMTPKKRLKNFANWQDLWSEWEKWLAAEQLTPVQACLAFVLSYPEVSRVVVGVDCIGQLTEILAAIPVKPINSPNSIESADILLINPSKWKKQ